MAYLIDLIATSKYGYKNQKPVYGGEDANSTLHYTYSVNGTPKQTRPVPNPTKYAATPDQTKNRYVDNNEKK